MITYLRYSIHRDKLMDKQDTIELCKQNIIGGALYDTVVTDDANIVQGILMHYNTELGNCYCMVMPDGTRKSIDPDRDLVSKDYFMVLQCKKADENHLPSTIDVVRLCDPKSVVTLDVSRCNDAARKNFFAGGLGVNIQPINSDKLKVLGMQMCMTPAQRLKNIRDYVDFFDFVGQDTDFGNEYAKDRISAYHNASFALSQLISEMHYSDPGIKNDIQKASKMLMRDIVDASVPDSTQLNEELDSVMHQLDDGLVTNANTPTFMN